ncbi:MAG TPA: histidine kinase dimerization/phospho-acceptor domain-containing protein [Bacteroidia bacterium]|nr:histidine kinase dimerization/phospho-acceptor domain-containing protein [Bacteroidia bacterium]
MNSNLPYQPGIMSQISHELRIPLTGIMGMAQFLSETPLSREQKEYLQAIQISAERLLGLEDKIHALLKGNQTALT